MAMVTEGQQDDLPPPILPYALPVFSLKEYYLVAYAGCTS